MDRGDMPEQGIPPTSPLDRECGKLAEKTGEIREVISLLSKRLEPISVVRSPLGRENTEIPKGVITESRVVQNIMKRNEELIKIAESLRQILKSVQV